VTTLPLASPRRPGTTPPAVDVVVPTHDEARVVERSVRCLHAHLSRRVPFSWRITIADNGSTDATPELARRLAAELPGVRALVVDGTGRGLALRTAWAGSDAAVLAYMDVDLSTDLDALVPLVAPLLAGTVDVAIGSRLAEGALTERGLRREVVSRAYNALLRVVLRTRFLDAQCGFKAIRADTARALLADVVDDGWFFDTELLVLAQRRGLRLAEVPVAWTDDPDSRVALVRTALDDLRGVWRLAVHDRRAGRHARRHGAGGDGPGGASGEPGPVAGRDRGLGAAGPDGDETDRDRIDGDRGTNGDRSWTR
jgi:glycosyltransferase involved in cell wall biosynthesis